jgi:polysaccharide biosynthesis PFTS motif protein
MRAQLRGARKLRNENSHFFVEKVISELTNVHLGINKKDFPKSLVGAHADKGEVLLRQIFLQGYAKLCAVIMQLIVSKSPIKYPLPKSWLKHISDNGISTSLFIGKVYLLLSSLKRIIYGSAKFCVLLVQKRNPINPDCPYVLFLGLQQNNLPNSNRKKSYDIISWYNESILKNLHVRKVWVQAKVKDDYSLPTSIIVSRFVFPRMDNVKGYFQFLFKGISALIVAVFGVLRGKWWYGFLYPEAINLHYVNTLKSVHLAEEYFFNNSNWYYKPLWTYEAEKKGSTVSLYYYSTNMEKFNYDTFERADTYGLNIMKWKHIIVWDQQQADYLKKFCPEAHYKIVGIIDFSDSDKLFHIPTHGFNIAIFDVTPTRPVCYTGLGWAIAPYYSEELSLQFFMDIKTLLNDNNINLLWKQKRIVGRRFISNSFIKKRVHIINKLFVTIGPEVSAKRLIDKCDAVISMPFTSTSIIGKELGKPSIFYDASSSIKKDESHGIPVLKNKDGLENWLHSLNIETPLSTNA